MFSSTATAPSGLDLDLDVARDERVGLRLGGPYETEGGDDGRRERQAPTSSHRGAARAGVGGPGRRSGRWRCGGGAGVGREVDLRYLALRLVRLEELALREAERACEDDARERLDRVVVGQHRVVVDLPRDRDAVLGAGELVLELAEVLVGLQLGVGLGHREQPPERRAEDALRGRRLGRPARALGVRARLGDGLERAALVLGVAAHGLDEVRDQIPPPLQLHLDLRPRVVDAVPQLDEAVVEEDEPQEKQGHHDEDHDQPDHAGRS